jgi:Na+/melibiose symporter-like transporter
VGLLAAIRHRPVPVAVPSARPLRDWTAGLAAIRSSRALSVLLLFFAMTGIGEAVMGTLFAPFVHDVLGGGAAVYGAILSAQAVGGIVGGLVVTAVAHRVRPRRLLGTGAVVFGALDLVLFLSPLVLPTAWPAVVLIAVVGLPGAALSAGLLTVFQLSTTDALRGRVFGALTTAQNGTMLVGTVAAGGLAAGVGVLPVILVQGVAYVLAGAAVLTLLRPA